MIADKNDVYANQVKWDPWRVRRERRSACERVLPSEAGMRSICSFELYNPALVEQLDWTVCRCAAIVQAALRIKHRWDEWLRRRAGIPHFLSPLHLYQVAGKDPLKSVEV